MGRRYKEPCSVCVKWERGKACRDYRCPVYKMKEERAYLRRMIEHGESKWVNNVCESCGYDKPICIHENLQMFYAARYCPYCGCRMTNGWWGELREEGEDNG